MKNILVAGALALGLFGFAGDANAQFVTGTGTFYNPYNNTFMNQGTIYAPNRVQTVTNAYSPFFGTTQRQVITADIFGNRVVQTAGFNPWVGGTTVQSYGFNPYTGAGFNRGYTVNPYLNLRYRYGYRW